MKVILNDADAFRAMVTKVAPVVKDSVFSFLRKIKLEAENGELTVTAANAEDFLILSLPGRVIEDGICFIEYDDLRKMNVKGFDITIDADDHYINIKSSGKSFKTANYDCSGLFPEAPEINSSSKDFGCIGADILSNLKPLSVMADAKATRTLMSTIRFDLDKQRLITLDGHRVGIWNLPHCGLCMKPFNISLNAVGILKAAIEKNTDGNIGISCDGKNVRFYCYDFHDPHVVGFSYITKCIEGNYYSIDSLIETARKDYDYEFSVDGKELAEISKEYKKGFNKDDMCPMLFFGNKDSVMTAFNFGSFLTADKFTSLKWEYYVNESNFFKGVNPVFIADACAFLGEEISVRSNFSEKKPFYFSSDGDEKIVLILPVNIISDGNPLMSFAMEQLQ